MKMEHEYNDHDLTLLQIMDYDSELEYITRERNLIPSMIEQICTELTGDKSDGAAYRSNVLVRKESVDYLESLGYNLFRQFESEMFCEYFDRPIAKESDEDGYGTIKFAIVTTLEYALDIFTYALPLSLRMPPPAIIDSSRTLGEIVFPSSPQSRRNRLDNEASSSNSPVNNLHSRSWRSRLDLPVWGSTERLPTSHPNLDRLLSNLSSEEDSLDSEGPSNRGGVFVKVVTLRSTLRNGYSSMSKFKDLNIGENADSNSGTPEVLSTQNNADTSTDSSESSGTMKYASDKYATKMDNNSSGTNGIQRNLNPSTLGLYLTSNENSVEFEYPAARGGPMEYKYSATTRFSPTPLTDGSSSSSDSFDDTTWNANMEYRNLGNSSFPSTWFNSNPSISGSYGLFQNEKESRFPLTWNNNYSEVPKADEVNEEDFSLPKKLNVLENHLDRKREDCVRLAVSLDASPEDSNLSDQEQAGNGLFICENSYFPKHLALKRSASSPAASPRSSFRTFRNPKKGRLSQPDFTDSNTSAISNFSGISTTNNISFSDANIFYSQSQEPSQENFPNTTAHQSEFTLSVQQQEYNRMFQHREEHSESFLPEDNFECTRRQTDYFDSFKHQNSLDPGLNRKSSERQESEDSKLSAIFYRLQDSEGLIQSIEITTDDQVHGANTLPPIDLSLVWNRKYCDSKYHVAFNLTHPLHYKREYDRIRQSRLSVFDSLMSRQTNGPLSQRKVLEVVARPHYNIYPPTDETDIKRCEQSRSSNEFMNVEGYLLLSLESCRTFDSYPTSSSK